MGSHVSFRSKELPSEIRHGIVAARHEQGLSQAELGRRVGLPQMHISAIETGRVTPRYDTLLDVVRVLGYEFVLVPRELVPVVVSIVRDHGSEAEDRPLYSPDEPEDSSS